MQLRIPHIALTLLFFLAGCQSKNIGQRRYDSSLGAARRFLLSQQDADGAWRSSTYGALKDGPALTPLVLTTLVYLYPEDRTRLEAISRGAYFLCRMAPVLDPSLNLQPIGFPTYTAALASWAVMLGDQTPQRRDAQSMWLKFISTYQLNRRLGWESSDIEFGGWGYSHTVPRRNITNLISNPLLASNLSATLFAAGALRAARVPLDDPIYGEIRTFVERCQNFNNVVGTDAGAIMNNFDDGGFFFTTVDSPLNKAGSAGADEYGKLRFHSYGSATADGLRLLLLCGLPPESPRVSAARNWLEQHFAADRNPGEFTPDREIIRNATYYYYTWSIAHAFARLNVTVLSRENGTLNWPRTLADELIRRQRSDGSWSNSFTDAKENDPLIATSFAAAALTICRDMQIGIVPVSHLTHESMTHP
jgi:squalene-hopene/tetraprenyl-beta-curcumene cyclase